MKAYINMEERSGAQSLERSLSAVRRFSIRLLASLIAISAFHDATVPAAWAQDSSVIDAGAMPGTAKPGSEPGSEPIISVGVDDRVGSIEWD